MANRAFFGLFVRPVLHLLLGLKVTGRQRLPTRGPAIIVANHNSHLDTLALASLFHGEALANVRPAAAADHFGKPGLLGSLAHRCLDIIPVQRHGAGVEAALAPVVEALRAGAIVIFFPEGSRGEPERCSHFRRGIAHLAEAVPEAPIVPVHLRGFGKAMPRGGRFILPASCEIVVGPAADLVGVPARDIPAHLEALVADLGATSTTALWDDEASAGELVRSA